jgi:hypothetical protein
MTLELSEPVELGSWMGRAQAFGMVANHCSAAQAQSLRRIRDAAAYKLLHLTWEDFCREHAGLSRPRVDALILCLEEFGEAYFRLSEIIRISPETYRQLAPKIQGEQIEIDGELLDIAPQNATRIRQAIVQLRSQLQKSTEIANRASMPAIADLHNRLDECFHKMAALANCQLSPSEVSGLHGLINFANHSLRRLEKRLEE